MLAIASDGSQQDLSTWDYLWYCWYIQSFNRNNNSLNKKRKFLP